MGLLLTACRRSISKTLKRFVGAAGILTAAAGAVQATTYTTTVPGTTITLPADYPEAGGVAIVMVGVNGNIYYQFSDPANAFRGFNFRANRDELEGNPFTINDPLPLDCGFSSCRDYFGGDLAQVHIRFSAYDGDTQVGGFDFNDIELVINGFDVGNWSGRQTQITNNDGTTGLGFVNGFGNNTFNTTWFESSNPALLNNLLDTGLTTTQVRDDDPNDNFWDFQRGPSLPDPDIITVAPGVTFEKSVTPTTFTAVGDVLTYSYEVANIGSVPITGISVADDKIDAQGGAVSCPDPRIDPRAFGDVRGPDTTTCTGTYTVTQDDFDNEFVTNIASATGTPSEGELGVVTDTEMVTGPVGVPGIDLQKTSTLSTFGAAGTTVPYTFAVENTGDVTLTNVLVTDTRITGLSCSFASILPGITETCTGNYTVLQSDVDAFGNVGTQLSNTASVTADTPKSGSVGDTATLDLDGPAAAPALALGKIPLTASYAAVGDTLQYRIELTNLGNISFSPPTITDTLGVPVTCPAVTVMPGDTVNCTASYNVDQDDINNGQVDNTVNTSLTVGGVTTTGTADATVTATQTATLALVKQLAAASPTNFNDAAVTLSYEYVLTNTGNVTLETPSVVDDKTTVICVPTEILPGTSITCTGSYDTLQGDLDAGGVTNLATASANQAVTGTVISSAQQSLTVPAVAEPALTLAKSPPAAVPSFLAGETVTYTFEVTNSGNVEIAGPISVTDDKIGTFACLTGPLARGAVASCTQDYILTVADQAAGIVVNTATVSDGVTTSPSDSATISNATTAAPAVTVGKVADVSPIGATDTSVTYNFTITNSGNVPLLVSASPITINDAKLPGGVLDCSGVQPASLAIGSSFVCQGTYTGITQTERDAGEVVNTASASFPFNSGGVPITVTSPSASATTPITEDLDFTFAKSGPTTFLSLGEVLTYTFEFTNTGNITISSVTVSDDLIASVSCPITDLLPGATDSCSATYVVTQPDIDAGSISNDATGTAASALGSSLTSPVSNVLATLAPAGDISSMSVDKTADLGGFTAVGEMITYTIEVTNTGTKTLTGTAVTDILDPGFSCSLPPIAPLASNNTCQFTYTVDQDDIDAGQIVNSASATNPAIVGPVSSGLTLNGPARVAGFEIEKNARGGFTSVGDTVTYDITVRNTGNVSIDGVTVTDASIFSPAETCAIGTIAPGYDQIACSLIYTVVQDDLDRGFIDNTASVAGTGADGTSLNESATERAMGPAENASVIIDKIPADGVYSSATDSEAFTFAVTNNGNVTLTGLTVTDREPDGSVTFTCTLDDLLPGVTATTCSGAGLLGFTKSFDQGDVDAGSYTNTATVTGQSLVNATPVTDDETETVTGPAGAPALDVTKNPTFVGTFDTLGQEITYEYVVQNTGNITLTGPITVEDAVTSQTPNVPVSVTCPATPGGGIAPGGTLTCTSSYFVTQNDLDVGSVTNTATASITQPVVGVPGPVTVSSGPDSATVNGDQLPTYSLSKAVATGSATTYTEVGDQITFEYTVRNTGNVTITSPITVSDDQITGTTTCGPLPLAPLGEVTCQLVWTAEQGDINAGSITNVGTATSTQVPVDATANFTAFANQLPELAMVKDYVSGIFGLNEVVNYSYTITNPGNTTIDTSSLTVTDNRIAPGDITCPPGAGPLLPRNGNSFVCTATYTVTFGDGQLGEVTNLASVSDGTTTSPNAVQTIPIGAVPSLDILKELVSGANFTAVGDPIVYRFTVTNTTGGTGAPFTAPINITDDKIGTFECYAPPVGDALNATESETCEATYLVTQDDLDAGQVTNEAFGTTIFAPTGAMVPVTSAPVTLTVGADSDPELTVTKSISAGPVPPAVDDVLTYTIVTTNSGNQTISSVMVSDPLIPTLTCTVSDGVGGQVAAPANVVLLPTEALTCSGAYTVTQTNIDDQQVVNTASAAGNDPSGAAVAGTGGNTQATEVAAPELTVTKAVTPAPMLATDPAFSSIDQPVTFIVTVENTGNVTVDSIDVTDLPATVNAVSPANCAVGTLAPGEVFNTCTFVVETTQTEVDNGSFDNTATADGVPRAGPATIQGTTTITVLGPDAEPGFSMSKSADVADFDTVGDIITYTYDVGNTGNVTLFAQPVVTDDKIGTFNCGTVPAAGIPPLGIFSCTATYAVPQDDVDAGFVTNNASIESAEVTTPALAAETVNALRSPGVSMSKSPSIASGAQEGDVITYTYTVTNTGNTRLFDVAVSDDHTSASGTAALAIAGDTLDADNGETGNSSDAGVDGSWDTLGPGDVVTFTSTYTVLQADIDAGADLSNTATVMATGPPGTTAPNDSITVNVPVELPVPELTALKTVTGSTGTIAGSTVTFEITVNNSGNVTLDAPVLTDTLTRTDGFSLALTTGPIWDAVDAGLAGELDVGETWTYAATYELTQDDIDAGGVANSVLVESAGPDGTPTDDLSGNGLPGGDDSPTVFSVPATPAISGEKTITSSTVIVGELVTFEITATNDGNVTLTGVTVSADTLTRAGDPTPLALNSGPTFSSSSAGSPSGTLIPGETATFVASYILTQEDIDAGSISNTATVSGTPPLGSPISDVTDDGDDSDGNTDDDSTDLIIPAAPALSLAKTLATGEPGNYQTLNQVVNFDFTISNDGNVTLAGPFTVSDPLIEAQGGAVTCPAVTLEPGDTVVCTGSYSVTQDDLDTGSFTNAATASDGVTNSPSADITVPALQLPALEVLKVADSLLPADFDDGTVVGYTYTVTNTGNTTLETPVTINDNLIPTVTCDPFPAAGIPPTGTYECTGNYTITPTDVDLAAVTNIASATDGVTTSPLVSETIPNAATPSLSIVKTAAPGSTFGEVGDVINYTFDVTNDGTQAFSAELRIFDNKINDTTGLVCYTPSAANPTLSVGETVSCSFPYAVDQNDLDAGEVVNEAFAQTTFGAGSTPVSSAPTSETVAADEMPALSLSKSSSPNPAGPVGSTVTYTLIATNTGNQTLNNIVVSDPLLPALSCSVATLARGGTLNCTGDYIVEQINIDDGTLVNTASIVAQNPSGALVGGPGAEIIAMETTGVPAANPLLTVAKTASPPTLGPVGSFVTYSFEVVNTGNITLTNVTVDDVLDTGPACVIPTLAVGATDAVSCSFMLEVTQDMVDAGEVTNRVDVTATDTLGNPTSNFAEITTPGPARVPALESTKTATFTGPAVGDVVTYTLQVENTGNVTLTMTGLTDTTTRLNGTATALDAPFAAAPFLPASGDLDGDDLLDVGEIWTYTATHTIVQSDINAGGFSNTVSVTADGPAGSGSTSDVSDDGDDGDGNVTDDPTVFNIAGLPAIVSVKTVASTTGSDAGDTVTFEINARNTGNVDLTDVGISDTLLRANGQPVTTSPSSAVTADILVGADFTWTVTYVLEQADIDSGGLSNSATVTGTPPSGGIVSDITADDDLTDGELDSDPTEFTIPAMPSLDALKTVTTPGVREGDVMVFTIAVENTGNVTLNSITVADTIERIDGTPLTIDSVTFVPTPGGSPEGTLAVGETATYEARYTLVLADVDAGGVSNSAVVSATTPLGATLSDISRDDDPLDGNDVDDPTVALIAPTPTNSLVKTAGVPQPLFPMVYQVTFALEVTNTGNVTQSGYQIIDDLTDFAGSAEILRAAPFGIAVRSTGFTGGAPNGAYDGLIDTNTLTGDPTLIPGQTGTVEIDLVYTTEFGGTPGANTATATSTELPTPTPSNPATVTVTDTDGDGVPDSLESCGPGSDRDGDGVCDQEDYDPTGYFYCEDDGRLLPGGSISVTGPFGTQTGVGTSSFITIVQDGATDGQFQFFVTRPGTYTLTPTYPSLGDPSTTRLVSPPLDATSLLPSNPASIGSSEFGNSNRLADFSAGANPFHTTFIFEPGDPFILNNNIPLQNCLGVEDVLATKVSDRDSAVFGETVNFTLTFTNNTTNVLTPIGLVDQLPAGLLYTPGTAMVDGAPLEPAVAGLRLNWDGLTIAPTQTITVTLAARVVANGSYGELVNRSFMTDAAGNTLSNVATATVRVEPEHVFDCADIIGKVYDDKNQNGYQDDGEPGLPGVRLATLRGYLITTDEYGRYHVPCAELPKDIGSNFTLKLDTRTLPTGYRVTTENPRVIRVTAGKFAKLNFGAALSRVVDIDLTQTAFIVDSNDPVEALVNGVDNLIAQINAKPSVLRLSYILKVDEDRKVAALRLKTVEDLIRERWRSEGRYKLNIERTIKRVLPKEPVSSEAGE